MKSKKSKLSLLLGFEAAIAWVVFYSFAGNTTKMVAAAIAVQPLALAALFGDRLGAVNSGTPSPLRKKMTIVFVAYILLFIVYGLLVLWLASTLFGVDWATS